MNIWYLCKERIDKHHIINETISSFKNNVFNNQ